MDKPKFELKTYIPSDKRLAKRQFIKADFASAEEAQACAAELKSLVPTASDKPVLNSVMALVDEQDLNKMREGGYALEPVSRVHVEDVTPSAPERKPRRR